MPDYRTRSIEELTNVESEAWPEIFKEIQNSDQSIRILPVSRTEGLNELHKLQVTTRSYMGALATSCGGIMFNNGFLRLLGGGSSELPSISKASGLEDEPVGALAVGYDVTGGVFAFDGGGLGISQGKICYYSVDTLDWQGLDITHSQLVEWAIYGEYFKGFYENLLWDGWEQQTKALLPNYGFSMFPPPSTSQWQIKELRSVAPVPLKEIAEFSTGIDMTA